MNKNKIEILFPNGEKIECDNLIALLQNDNLVEEFEQLLIGNWSLNELIETKFFLNQMYDEKIKEKLSAQDKLKFERLQKKKQEQKKKLEQSLSAGERELYNFLEPEPELIMSGDLPDDLDEQDIDKFFDEIFDNLEQLDKNSSQLNQADDFEDEKVVDIEKYRKD
ncbi:MAG: hypothetical protein ACQEP9_04910 [Bacillota bacterium]